MSEPTTRGLDPAWVADQIGAERATFDGFIGTGQIGRNARFSITGHEATSVVVKVPADDPGVRQIGFDQGLYPKECLFYREIVDLVEVRTPRPLAVDIDPAAVDFALVLEDMAQSEAGDQFTEATVEAIETHRKEHLEDSCHCRPAVVDWQTLTIGASVSDVAYLLGAAIDPARRREVEHDQLATYRDLLAGYGVEYDAETCWNEYALASLHGIVVGITATIMATETERGNNLFALMLNRHARHAIDVDALDRLAALA